MKLNFLINKDFLFKPSFNKTLSVFIYIINYIINSVFIQNNFNINIIIL